MAPPQRQHNWSAHGYIFTSSSVVFSPKTSTSVHIFSTTCVEHDARLSLEPKSNKTKKKKKITIFLSTDPSWIRKAPTHKHSCPTPNVPKAEFSRLPHSTGKPIHSSALSFSHWITGSVCQMHLNTDHFHSAQTALTAWIKLEKEREKKKLESWSHLQFLRERVLITSIGPNIHWD